MGQYRTMRSIVSAGLPFFWKTPRFFILFSARRKSLKKTKINFYNDGNNHINIATGCQATNLLIL